MKCLSYTIIWLLKYVTIFYLKLRTTPYKLWNHNSLVRRPVYSVFNGNETNETLSYLAPKKKKKKKIKP